MNTMARPQADYVPLGFISGVYGVKGWVKVHSYTRPREAILEYKHWLLGPDRRQVTLRDGRRQGKTLVASINGIGDRDAASALVQVEIAVKREQLPALAAGEYYWADLVGLEVRTCEGIRLGTVERLVETGANDVLVVQGDRERWIPFVLGQYVTGVDLTEGRLEVDWDPEF
jgi:16S rRNA processing protein RimM